MNWRSRILFALAIFLVAGFAALFHTFDAHGQSACITTLSGVAGELAVYTNATTVGPINILSTTAPTITGHFNTSGDSISSPTSTAGFTVTVGTGAAGNTGTIGLPTATTGWNCFAANMNRGAYIQQTATSTSSCTLTNYGTTVGTPVNWTNSDVLHVSAFAY